MKNTIKTVILDMLCPHFCYFCGLRGKVLCSCCKKYIESQAEMKKITIRDGSVCWRRFSANDDRLSCPVVSFDSKEGVVFSMIKEYKYRSVRALAKELAEFLVLAMGGLCISADEDVVVVALPTISKHIRQRGFDHMATIARCVAKSKG